MNWHEQKHEIPMDSKNHTTCGMKIIHKTRVHFFQKQEGLFKKIAIMKMMGPPGPRSVPIFKNASPDGRLLPKRKTGGWFPPTSKHRETPTRCPCCQMKLFNSGGLTGDSRFQKAIRNTEVATFAAKPLIIFWWFQTTKRKCHNRIQLIQCLFEKAYVNGQHGSWIFSIFSHWSALVGETPP